MGGNGENTIVVRPTPPSAGKPRVDFRPDEMDTLVQQKGLDVIHETAIVCPCKSAGGDSALSTCRNCGGTGIVFINPVKERMVVQSISRDVKRVVDWSSELKGTVSLTTRNSSRLGDMDRVTLVGSRSRYSQLVHLKKYEDTLYGFLVYRSSEILDIFMYDGADAKLRRLKTVEYTVDGNALILNKSFLTKFEKDGVLTLTVRYEYEVQYLITEQGHEIRDSYVLSGKKDSKKRLPVSAIARRLHYVLASSNLDGRLLLDNSYIFPEADDSCKI